VIGHLTHYRDVDLMLGDLDIAALREFFEERFERAALRSRLNRSKHTRSFRLESFRHDGSAVTIVARALRFHDRMTLRLGPDCSPRFAVPRKPLCRRVRSAAQSAGEASKAIVPILIAVAVVLVLAGPAINQRLAVQSIDVTAGGRLRRSLYLATFATGGATAATSARRKTSC
jgi:hypothetical protein